MAWEASTWQVLVRLFQLVELLVVVGLNGFLTVMNYTERYYWSPFIMVIEVLLILLAIYTTLALVFRHTGQRSKRPACFVCFIVTDSIACATILAIITLLARAGLPKDCDGFATFDGEGEMASVQRNVYYYNAALPKLTLQKFCGLERSTYSVAISLVFTYIATIVLTVLRIFERNYTKNSKVSEVLDSLERTNLDEFKLSDDVSSHSSTPTLALPSRPLPPPSEGIVTRSNSLRSTVTASTSHAGSSLDRACLIPRRPVGQPPAPQAKPSIPPMPVIVSAGGVQHQGFVTVTLEEEDEHDEHDDDDDDGSAEAALVADGMQHREQQQQRDQQFRLPMLPEEEQSAASALVSDGMRPSEPSLPPYYPRNGGGMPGHSSESNEMRLSEYVKGETRAQNLKDSGRY
ncbi:hypothetical protein B0T24DRAFT_79646 [Lasiosphaeria ovina]|uniref:Uncharacterized protein n=1 Tax=Lasiosphaeria ovina TaxID=92902 RepID=A0AAE0NMS1_9PEZI|nr:hypothetical protein B0T24DRAFT_79646 [Lasiosphaeria ovina]